MSQVPVRVGVVSFVRLSVFEVPVSLEASRSGADGAAGVLVSIVTPKAGEAAETLFTGSVAVTVISCAPLVSVLVIIV